MTTEELIVYIDKALEEFTQKLLDKINLGYTIHPNTKVKYILGMLYGRFLLNYYNASISGDTNYFGLGVITDSGNDASADTEVAEIWDSFLGIIGRTYSGLDLNISAVTSGFWDDSRIWMDSEIWHD
jgi:hypothetical protein